LLTEPGISGAKRPTRRADLDAAPEARESLVRPAVRPVGGAQGDIVSINYAGSDCGYGIGQVTTGMHFGDGDYSPHGQLKIAVDYQENIAAALAALAETELRQLVALLDRALRGEQAGASG
jgi:hypothetical protein